MKKLIGLFLIMVLTFSLKSQEFVKFGNTQFGKDKIYHAVAGATISLDMVLADKYLFKRGMNPVAPALIAFTAGFGKEMYDCFTTGNFSSKDLIWTTASATVVNIVAGLILKPNKNKRRNKTEEIFDFNPPLTGN